MVKRKKRSFRISINRGEKARLGPYAFGNAFGSASAVFLLIYAVIVWFSDYTGQYIIGQYPIPFSFSSWSILIGFAQTYAICYVFGWIMAKIYNKSLNK